MSAPASFRGLSLGDLEFEADGLERLLAEDETLFVEHKRDIAKGQGYQLAKAVASFANTLGGWILIGVSDGAPWPDWSPPNGGFIDAVRQRLQLQIDPVPSFAARVLRLRGAAIGVVRVYESADTPHVLTQDGSIVIREPAQDAKLRRNGRYAATPIRSHYELAQLASRGSTARDRASRLLEPEASLLIEEALDIRWQRTSTDRARQPAPSGLPSLALRLAPLTATARWPDWAVSESTVNLLRQSAQALLPAASRTRIAPFADGVIVDARSQSGYPWTHDSYIWAHPRTVFATDGQGVLGVSSAYELRQNSGAVHYWRELVEGAAAGELLQPVIRSAIELLAQSELLGRYRALLTWSWPGELFRVDPTLGDEDPHQPPTVLLAERDVTVDGQGTEREAELASDAWSRQLARAYGAEVWG